jgi:hypothetical protein
MIRDRDVHEHSELNRFHGLYVRDPGKLVSTAFDVAGEQRVTVEEAAVSLEVDSRALPAT